MQKQSPSIQDLATKKHQFYRWNSTAKAWLPQKQFSFGYYEVEAIKTLSFNILLDEVKKQVYKKNVVFSQERYENTLNDVEKIFPHIASFNEVMVRFIKMLQEKTWVRENYWISAISSDILSLGTEDTDKAFGNVLITRIPPQFMEVIKMTNSPRPAITGFFYIKHPTGEKKVVSFSAVHLTAYKQYYQRREIQLKSLNNNLQKFNKLVDCHVLQGDMNFHSEDENKILPQLKYEDCWLEFHNHNLQQYPGYTFDADYNSLINQLWWGFQGRRMRLDRIFYTHHGLTVKNIKVIFDEPIYGQKKKVQKQGKIKGSIALLFDLFDKNAFREKQNYLFKSDHFGLQAQLVFQNKEKGKL